MSRPRSTPRERDRTPAKASPPEAIARSPRARWGTRWLAVGTVAILALIAAVFWINRGPGSVPVPPVNLVGVDPSVAATIQKQVGQVDREPRSATAWGHLGIVLREYGYKSEARICLDQAERLEPSNPRWPYAHALLLLVHTPEEAAVKLRRVVALCGNEPEAPRFRLARILGEQGRWPEAEVELAALLEARPDFAPARLLTALGARAAGNLARATTLANGCTEDARTRRAAWALLATLHRQQGDEANAEKAARRSAALPGDDGFGDPFEAEAILLRGDPRALTEHAHPLLATGRLNEAARLIERLEKEHPDYPETWLLVGRLELLRKDPSAAEKSFRRHLELAPRSAQGWFQLGLALLNQNRFVESAEASRRATEIKADFGPAFFNRGVALARAGRPKEAVTAFEETIRHHPEHFESYVLLADLHLQSGQRAEALKLLDQAGVLNPSDRRLAPLRQRATR